MSGWVTAQAPTRAELAACVECGLCLPHCPTFRLTGLETASPRGRLAAMSAVAAGVAEVDSVFEEIMGFCLQCRACEAVCPGLVPFGRAMEGARIELAAQRPSTVRRLRHFLWGRFVPSRRAIALATVAARAFRSVPLPLPRGIKRGLAGLRNSLQASLRRGQVIRPEGKPLATVGLLLGCVMDAWFGRVHVATVDLLRRAGYLVVLPTSQTCCGALAAHDGGLVAGRRLAERNQKAFAGLDLIVANAAGCSAHLKDYGHWLDDPGDFAGKVRDINEIVASAIEEGRLPRFEPIRGRVAVQDPCHLRHAQRVMAAPRQILAAAGYAVVEIDPDGLCCGAAGSYALTHPDASAELGRRKAEQVRASGALLVASANPGCEMQLRSYLDQGFEIAHPIEFYHRAVIQPE